MAKYKLLDSNILFSDSAERFFDMQHRAWNATASAAQDFEKWYKSCGNILAVLKGYEEKAAKLVIQYANKPLFEELTDLEIYDISEDSYDEECLVFTELSKAFDTIVDKYNDIVAEQEAEEEYRAERKENRGRVVGGGFGVGGAIKGMATAGAMNAISGMGHSLVNAIGNAGSALSASSSKRALYENSATLKVLKEGIKSDIINCFNAHMHLVNSRIDSYIVSSFDSDKADAFFQNAKKVNNKRKELLLESFKNCPWNEEVLEYIFIQYAMERHNIWKIGERFHVDLHEVAEKAFAFSYTDEARASEHEAQKVKKEILAQMAEFGIKSSATVDQIEIDSLNRIIKSYTKSERDEMVKAFDSYDATQKNKANIIHDHGIWELAKKYSVRFSQEEVDAILSKYYTDKAKQSEEEAILVRNEIILIMNILGVSESAILDKLEFDCMERICKNYQEANEETCNDIIKKINEFEALEKNKLPFLKKIQGRIENIWAKEDGEIFDNIYQKTNIFNAESIKESIEYIKQKGRTSSSEKYITALTSCNLENIQKAKKYKKTSTKFCAWCGWILLVLGIVLWFMEFGFVLGASVVGIGIAMLTHYYGVKKIWDVLTLNGTVIHHMFSLSDKEMNKQEKIARQNMNFKQDTSNQAKNEKK